MTAETLSRLSGEAGFKIVALCALVAAAFMSFILLGFAADGHGLYSDDYYAWLSTTEKVSNIALVGGGIAMWALLLLGGRAGRESINRVVFRAALGIFGAIVLHLLMFSEGGHGVDLESSMMFVLLVAGSVLACVFAGGHSWRALALAGAPYAVALLTVAFFLAFAPPNTAML